MSKLVIGLTAFVLLAAGGALAGGALTGSSTDDPFTTGTTTGEGASVPTGTTTRTETAEDVRGPCDEAENANDPRCAGGALARPGEHDRVQDDDRAEDDDRHGEDGSGPNRGHDGSDDRSGADRGRGDDD